MLERFQDTWILSPERNDPIRSIFSKALVQAGCSTNSGAASPNKRSLFEAWSTWLLWRARHAFRPPHKLGNHSHDLCTVALLNREPLGHCLGGRMPQRKNGFLKHLHRKCLAQVVQYLARLRYLFVSLVTSSIGASCTWPSCEQQFGEAPTGEEPGW
jgi:hypothetical protein